MKHLNTLILYLVMILVVGYTFNKTNYLEVQADNKLEYFTENYSVQGKRIDATSVLVYCKNDTIVVVAETKEGLHNKIIETIRSLDCF